MHGNRGRDRAIAFDVLIVVAGELDQFSTQLLADRCDDDGAGHAVLAEYVPRHNQRFGVSATDEVPTWRSVGAITSARRSTSPHELPILRDPVRCSSRPTSLRLPGMSPRQPLTKSGPVELKGVDGSFVLFVARRPAAAP